MTDRRTQLQYSLYPDEIGRISQILKILNDNDVLLYLDGELTYYNENADPLAIFWCDGDAESWRVQILNGEKPNEYA